MSDRSSLPGQHAVASSLKCALLTKHRLAHRLRDMQTLPYVVVTNPHISHVYELYYKAFETMRRVREIRTVEDNDKYCEVISGTLKEHLTVIPRLAMGVLECQDLMQPEEMDKFMNTLLRSVCLGLHI
jgi:pyruvate dehydrogenase kinase 2/3/4